MTKTETIERVQRTIARILAMNREGVGLRLIGGFRYRLLDRSSRMSVDLDYHWSGDLAAKRDEVVKLLQRQLLPEVKRRLGFDGAVYSASGPGADSAFVKTAEVAVFKLGSAMGRIEIPVDITRIPCLDPPVAMTMDGTVYLTSSDADMVESKVLAVFLRATLEARDLVDLYLFRTRLPDDAGKRLAKKCRELELSAKWLNESWARIQKQRATIVSGINHVLAEQVEPPVADNLRAAGGAEMICAATLELVERITRKARGRS